MTKAWFRAVVAVSMLFAAGICVASTDEVEIQKPSRFKIVEVRPGSASASTPSMVLLLDAEHGRVWLLDKKSLAWIEMPKNPVQATPSPPADEPAAGEERR